MTLDILNDGKDVSAINNTHISLIPTVKNPVFAKDFKLISLCNVIYKLVSKVIFNRLRASMPSIILDNKSAFIENKLITDNMIVAFEAFHSTGIGRINGSNHFALKLYLNKAFNRIKWNFLEKVMTTMRFPPSLVSLIMRCVRSIAFSVPINVHQ